MLLSSKPLIKQATKVTVIIIVQTLIMKLNNPNLLISKSAAAAIRPTPHIILAKLFFIIKTFFHLSVCVILCSIDGMHIQFYKYHETVSCNLKSTELNHKFDLN